MTTISEGDIVISATDISANDITENDIKEVQKMNGNNTYAPLTEAVYYILISLYKPLHGYGIMQNVKEISNGRVNIGAGTLYGAINTLIEKGYIVEYRSSKVSRKKEYIITPLGKEIVNHELERLQELIYNGKNVLKEA